MEEADAQRGTAPEADAKRGVGSEADAQRGNLQRGEATGPPPRCASASFKAADRVASAIDNGAAVDYSDDDTNQLTADGTASYSYDANGNRTMAGYATSTGNRTTNDGTWTYTFDDAGNEIEKSQGAGAETWNYVYDNRNQLIAVEQHASDGGTLLAKVQYKYDALGDRIERDEDADDRVVVARR